MYPDQISGQPVSKITHCCSDRSPFRIVMTDSMRKMAGQMFSGRLGWMEMEPRPGLTSPDDAGDRSKSLTGSLFIPGSGIAKLLLEAW